jgi:C4-dicarboxylate-specific signal transduction histidine kinase
LLLYFRQCTQSEARDSEIHAVIRQSLDFVCHNHDFSRVAIVRDFKAGETWVSDFGLTVVFNNLFKNAYEAMNGAGELMISTGVRDGRLAVLVRDSGAGFPEHLRRRLFEPFFSTKKELGGCGLGLCLSKEIVEKSGGSLQVSKPAGGGTEFLIDIPVKAAVRA